MTTIAPTSTTTPSQDLLARSALGVAAFATVLAPIHALARFATEDGKADLDLPAVRFWAEPARDALSPILDWGSADTVYLTYGKLFLFVMLATTLYAFAVRRTRPEPTGAEKWGWRIALPAYVLLTVAMVGEYWSPYLEESFALLAIPGMLIGMVGSTVLGVGLMRRQFRPRVSALLLMLWIPLMVLLSSVIALGAAILPLVWAWALAVREAARSRAAWA